MHVSSPKIPKCTCYTNACSRRDIFIYLFIFKMLWARPWGISSRLKDQSNPDKDMNTRNILVLHHVKTPWGGRNTCRQERSPLTIEFRKSRHSHWHGRIEKFFPHAEQNWGSHWYKYTHGILLAVVKKIHNLEIRAQKFSNYCSTQQDYETHLWYTKIH
jgi:hypothetical protein